MVISKTFWGEFQSTYTFQGSKDLNYIDKVIDLINKFSKSGCYDCKNEEQSKKLKKSEWYTKKAKNRILKDKNKLNSNNRNSSKLKNSKKSTMESTNEKLA